MKKGSSMLRQLLTRRGGYVNRSVSSSAFVNETLIPTPCKTMSRIALPKLMMSSCTYVCNRSIISDLKWSRSMSSPSGSSNIVLIKSEEEFNSSFKKAQDESLPAIFYFTAAWCGPCRFISPVIEELSSNYPHVTAYKIDIDQDGLESSLSKLNIASVPTLFFFQNGKKQAEVIGADVGRLKDIMARLYKKE